MVQADSVDEPEHFLKVATRVGIPLGYFMRNCWSGRWNPFLDSTVSIQLPF
jgi:hypothetical protein